MISVVAAATISPAVLCRRRYGAINSPWRVDINQSNTVFDRWGGLIKDFGTHLVSRYGLDEVSSWDFELWK